VTICGSGIIGTCRAGRSRPRLVTEATLEREAVLIGAHSIIYSTNPEADRAFLRDILSLPSVDVGGGWLIFGLPPAELAVHPSSRSDLHELYLMCDDIKAFVE